MASKKNVRPGSVLVNQPSAGWCRFTRRSTPVAVWTEARSKDDRPLLFLKWGVDVCQNQGGTMGPVERVCGYGLIGEQVVTFWPTLLQHLRLV